MDRIGYAQSSADSTLSDINAVLYSGQPQHHLFIAVDMMYVTSPRMASGLTATFSKALHYVDMVGHHKYNILYAL